MICKWCNKVRKGIPQVCGHVIPRICEACSHPMGTYDYDNLREELSFLRNRVRQLEEENKSLQENTFIINL